MRLIILIRNWNKIFLLLLLLGVQFGYGQERENKVNTIIDSLESVETEKSFLIELNIEPFKNDAKFSKEDRIKLVKIEKQLTDEEIKRRVILAYNEAFTDDDINKLYDFVTSSAFRKLLSLSKNILNQFKDINAELRMISVDLGITLDDTNKIDNPIQFSYGQERENKINTIIDSTKDVESVRSLINLNMAPLEYGYITKEDSALQIEYSDRITREDSIKLVEIKNQLTDEEIRKRVIQAYNEVFTDEEIDPLYALVTSSAYHKLLSLNKSISNQFKDITAELRMISENAKKRSEREKDIEDAPEFIPIPVEREDGFYATINYDPSKKDKDIILEKNPAITKVDILEITKYKYSDRGIQIVLKKDGAKKLYSLTENNLGKPIAVVFDKHIVSLPIVNSVIPNGNLVFTGNFSEEEIEKIIKKWSNK